jgi:hypothetical protein
LRSQPRSCTLLSAALGALVLGERVTPGGFAGAALVVAGVAFVATGEPPDRPRRSTLVVAAVRFLHDRRCYPSGTTFHLLEKWALGARFF